MKKKQLPRTEELFPKDTQCVVVWVGLFSFDGGYARQYLALDGFQ